MIRWAGQTFGRLTSIRLLIYISINNMVSSKGLMDINLIQRSNFLFYFFIFVFFMTMIHSKASSCNGTPLTSIHEQWSCIWHTLSCNIYALSGLHHQQAYSSKACDTLGVIVQWSGAECMAQRILLNSHTIHAVRQCVSQVRGQGHRVTANSPDVSHHGERKDFQAGKFENTKVEQCCFKCCQKEVTEKRKWGRYSAPSSTARSS